MAAPTIIDKALDGTASSSEFRNFITSFMNDQNNLNFRSTHCSANRSPALLDFSQVDGGLVHVTPYDEMETSTKYAGDSITLTNNAKGRNAHRVYYEVCCKPNPKFKLLVTNPSGEIRPGKSVTIDFKILVFCTTKIYQMLKISLSKAKPKNNTLRGRKSLTSAMQEVRLGADQNLESELGRLWFAFKIESELSNQIDWDEIEIAKDGKIAKGGFGTVFRGTWRGSEVAVKLLNTQELVDEEKEMVKREMVLMSKLASPYMVTYMGSTLLPKMPWSIIMEFVSGGSLTELLHKHNNDMTVRFKVKLLQDIVAGMTYLHAHHICHRDIKPDNMLVVSAHETGVNLKVTDFGTSKASAKRGLGAYEQFDFNKAMASQGAAAEDGEDVLRQLNADHDSNNERRETRGVGTLIYQAPEILEGADLGDQIDKTDVYAFGILMWEVYTTTEPYSTGPTATFQKWDLEDFVMKGNRPAIPSDMPSGYKKIMVDCWAQSPASRPAFSEISKQLKNLFDSRPPTEQLGIIRRAEVPAAVAPPAPAAGGVGNHYSSSPLPAPGAAVASAAVGGDIWVEVDDRGVPVPFGGNLSDIGWGADMSRTQSEQKLGHANPGTFIIRWSANTHSYVLTYSKGGGRYQHIAYILPVKPDLVKIQVDKEDNKKQEYENIFAYIKAMRESGIITFPCSIPETQGGNTYSQTPF